MSEDGSCHVGIVETVVYDLIGLGIKMRDIIVRSTVPVGTCERLGVSFMPEFLTEANWKEDFKNNKDWIFGFDPPSLMAWSVSDNTAAKLLMLAKMFEKNVEILTTKEAELVKYTRNAFLATKVSFFNEIEEFCRELDISYKNVKTGVCLDNRIGFSHTQVPGPDGKRGFGGTCFPKDIASLNYQMTQHGLESYIVEGAKARNLQVDRAEKDWESEKGRAVV
jgi:UDPglucose 6-dehydrogenase